jgi:hypothetical protein
MIGPAFSRDSLRLISPIAVAVVLLAVILAGVAFMLLDEGAEDAEPPAGSTGSSVGEYTTISQLLDAPGALAIVGTVSRTSDPILVGGDANNRGTPFTDATISIEAVLAGTPQETSAGAVVVRQTGASSGPDAFELPGAKLMRQGEQVLLFSPTIHWLKPISSPAAATGSSPSMRRARLPAPICLKVTP